MTDKQASAMGFDNSCHEVTHFDTLKELTVEELIAKRQTLNKMCLDVDSKLLQRLGSKGYAKIIGQTLEVAAKGPSGRVNVCEKCRADGIKQPQES